MGSTEFDSAKEAERFMDIPLPIVTPGFTLEVKNKWPADPWPKVGQMIPDPSWGPPQFFDVESGKRIEEPVRIDYDLMEVVPADHFEEPVAVPVVVGGE